MRFASGALAGEENLMKFVAFLQASVLKGIYHNQFNVLSTETLRKAQKDPDNYRDLIVRVAGYSDHFRNLSRALQDEIIARTEQSFN